MGTGNIDLGQDPGYKTRRIIGLSKFNGIHHARESFISMTSRWAVGREGVAGRKGNGEKKITVTRCLRQEQAFWAELDGSTLILALDINLV